MDIGSLCVIIIILSLCFFGYLGLTDIGGNAGVPGDHHSNLVGFSKVEVIDEHTGDILATYIVGDE